MNKLFNIQKQWLFLKGEDAHLIKINLTWNSWLQASFPNSTVGSDALKIPPSQFPGCSLSGFYFKVLHFIDIFHRHYVECRIQAPGQGELIDLIGGRSCILQTRPHVSQLFPKFYSMGFSNYLCICLSIYLSPYLSIFLSHTHTHIKGVYSKINLRDADLKQNRSMY